ncbi:MAG: hypothetical protein Q8N28_03450, partial [bacterium]|nr:hypothetical protein [bacterium]
MRKPTHLFSIGVFFLIALALGGLAFPSDAVAATYSDKGYFTVTQSPGSFTVIRQDSVLPVAAATKNMTVCLYYAWQYDSSQWWTQRAFYADGSKYSQNSNLVVWNGVKSITIPLDPAYVMYFVNVQVTDGTDVWICEHVLTNGEATIRLRTLDARSVRLGELGSIAATATKLGSELPVALSEPIDVTLDTSATVSIPETLTVAVASVGELDASALEAAA